MDKQNKMFENRQRAWLESDSEMVRRKPDGKEGTPIRDLCALQKWAALRLCHRFLKECGLKI
jgi:hypothetical protein